MRVFKPPLRVFALEEHFLVPSLVEDNWDPASMNWLTPQLTTELADLGASRLRDMDEGGITQQIISASMPSFVPIFVAGTAGGHALLIRSGTEITGTQETARAAGSTHD
jgi:hypothetical protein